MRKTLGVVLVLAVAAAVPFAEAGSRQAAETVMEAGYDVGPGGTLRVAVPDADIELVAGSGDRVEVKVLMGAHDMDWGRRHFESMNLQIDGSGSEVTLIGQNSKQGFRWGRQEWFSLLVRVELPEDFNIELDSDDGDIAVERLRGSVKIRTADGDIRLGRIDARDASIATSDGDVRIDEIKGGEILIKSSDGDIEARRIDGTQVSIRTADGDISLADASGAIEASTSDGDIEVGAGRLGETSLTSADGDIVIRVAGGFGADVELRGEEVEIQGTTFDGERKESSATGRVNGGGARLQATTRDGSVAIRSR